ncbi:MAG TPA: pseudouridine synthase, partial [Thermoanaerobaculia bacterium]|nr:pseudouridine synthase [Thermoanaerobaculia bacterium]
RAGQTGQRALTRYRVLEHLGEAALVSIELETGRTHQIRVHFASAGHPVLGDPVYRARRAPPPPIPVPRQMLHARRLGLAHPRTGETVRTESPIPEDFREALARLRRKFGADRRRKDQEEKKAPRDSRGARNSRL